MHEEHGVDFLKKKYNMVPTKKQARKKRNVFKVIGAIFITLAICGILTSYQLAQKNPSTSNDFEHISLFSSLRNLVGSGEKTLTGESDDRINFLFLGIGGEGHDGPELSDTIMLASYRPSNNDIGILSIPRDLAVPIPGYGYQKINSINAYGELEDPGSGAQWSSDLIGDLLNQDIHYYVKVDFQGFVDLIDAIGGINVYVERSFTDTSYPTDDDLITTISFESGWTHMDGETALRFARSRHGDNGEGSDFARAERQQKILFATKDELLSASTFLNPAKLNNLVETFQENVETNMSFWELMKMTRYIPDIDSEHIHSTVLETGFDQPLYSTMINGSYVLLPKKDDWTPIQELAESIFSNDNTSSFVESDSEETALQQQAIVTIQNGTSVTGLAFQTSQMLAGTTFSVAEIGNADSQDYETTIIYDLTGGEKNNELELLVTFLEADIAMTTSGWVFSETVIPRELTVDTPEQTSESIDFLIILGENATNLVLQ